jgi:hypothetical protein
MRALNVVKARLRSLLDSDNDVDVASTVPVDGMMLD